MEKLTLLEQDITNALCLFHARFKNVQPETVEIELMYDDVAGFSAEAYLNGQMDVYNTVNFITALRLYIDEQLGRDSMSARIMLDLHDEEGIIANIEW
ncbi:YxcD family protein [Solibacillus sp. FSL H8-0538]|uniref:YxcD family protein n=1 Tax=Solibacillus sp. FSL H8-0538 TaxID=2921400 RepID=UPI0030F748A2